MTATTSAREELNRLRKALRIADLMQAAEISSALAQVAGEDDRKMAASAAGVQMPSAETWAVVVELLADREQALTVARKRAR